MLSHPSIGASVAYALRQELQWRNPPSFDELSEFWFSQFGHCAVPMPHLIDVLEQLKSKNYKLAVISNGGHETRMNILQGLGVVDFFDVIVSSGAFGMSKPKPEIFRYTADELQLDPSQCLYVGDHPINDIQGAKNAGMQALWLAGFHPEVEKIEHKIDDLKGLFEHLDYLERS